MFNDRVKTAIVLIPIMLAGIYLLPLNGFALFIGIIALLGAWEWADLSGFPATRPRIIYSAAIAALLFLLYLGVQQNWLSLPGLLLVSAVWWAVGWALIKCYPSQTKIWAAPTVRLAMGAFILASMWIGFYWIRAEDDSLFLITLLMLLVWGADIGAYYAGRSFGRRKLAPAVSPGKTWEGAVGGMITAALIALIVASVFQDTTFWAFSDYLLLVVFAAVVVALSIVGDLVESMVKRHRGLKDSGRLLPGHGGILDRIDSMSAAAPVFAGFLYLWPAL